MRTKILATVALLVAPLAHAGTIGDFEYEHPIGSAYEFDFGSAVNTVNGDSSYLYIDGPSGREWFRFGFLGSVGNPVMNQFGLLVSAGEATEDPYLYYAQYGFGGAPDGALSGVDGIGVFGLVPDVPRGDNVQYSMLSLTNGDAISGTVTWQDWSQPTEESSYVLRTDPWTFGGEDRPTGFTLYAGSAGGPSIFLPITVAPTAAPEPGTFALLGAALLGVAILRFRREARPTAAPLR